MTPEVRTVDPPFTDLFQLIPLLKRQVKPIAAAAVLGLVAAVIWVMVEVPVYRATAVLRVGEAREALTRGIEAPDRETERFVNPILSAIQLLRSRSLLGEVVDSAGLRLRPDYRGFEASLLDAARVAADQEEDTLWLAFGPEGYSARTRELEGSASYGQPVQVAGVAFSVTGQPSTDEAMWTVYPREQAIDGLLESLRVSPREQTNVVDVSYLHPNPRTAQSVVNTLVRAYQRFEADFAQERATRRRVFLEEQVAETESRLAEAQRALSTFQTRAQSYDAAGELAAQQQNRLLLDIRISELEADRRMLQGLLNRLDAASDEEDRSEVLSTLVSSAGIADNVVVAQMHERLLRQRSVLDSLSLGAFGAAGGSPEVLRQQEIIASAEQELTSAVRGHVAALDARAVALEELADRVGAALASIPPQLAQEAQLDQVVSTYQNLSDQLRQEFQKARIAEAVSLGEADIIDLATLPYEPAPRLLLVKLGLGLLLGLTFGGVGALSVEYRRRSVGSKQELESMFRLPVLSVIPESKDPAVTARSAGASNGDTEDEAMEGAVQALEAYRMLCTNLFFAGWTQDMRTLAITSTLPQEGKTVTAANLAVAMAGEGIRTLLVDADIWRGRIHEIFGVPPTPGLSEALGGKVSASDSVRASGLPGLWILPRGDRGPSPSLLAQRSPLKSLLDALGHDFDVVLVDGPPVLAAGSAPALAAVTDGVLLLVQAGRTDRDSVEEALRELETVGARVLGAILNDPDNVTVPDRGRYAYYEYASG